MKVFQIFQGRCHYDATRIYPTLDSIAPDQYPPSFVFVEAPDFVCEGWEYDETAEGDARFTEPGPPPVSDSELLAHADTRILDLEYQLILAREGLIV